MTITGDTSGCSGPVPLIYFEADMQSNKAKAFWSALRFSLSPFRIVLISIVHEYLASEFGKSILRFPAWKDVDTGSPRFDSSYRFSRSFDEQE